MGNTISSWLGSTQPDRIGYPLVSWTALQSKNVKYFSGEANYHKIFDYAQEGNDMGLTIWLDLGKVSKVTEVYLNGHHLGIKWFQPFIYNITKFIKSGKNYLIVEVANVWSNQMTGDANRIPEDKRTHSNITGSQCLDDPVC